MRALTFALLLLLAVPAFAQDLPDARTRAAERYQTATWPAPGPNVNGWAPEGFRPEGWTRVKTRLDARRAEARVDLAQTQAAKQSEQEQEQVQKQAPRGARLVVRRHTTSKAARAALLSHLMACTTTLEREEGLGEVAFSTRVKGRLVYLAGVRGDLSYTLRAVGDQDLEALASALDTELRGASKPSETKPRPRATLAQGKVGAANGRGEIPVGLAIEGDARSLALKASGGASVIRTQAGCVVYAEGEGAIELELLLLDKELRVSRHTLTVR